ncbi:2Fe-2S iron-sulfur cluster-binding protein [Bacillus sp. Marseille-P3661]|uniref:2Fe-2S iron-sulfur cluster-binding protein n=1 Tax=Bacillus sp. Marseille-P3661 TaxID=1936234 RepID=UPI0015E16CDD|nr:2Fe-2S iron-sulfur cluster-binding protein [Bacillus sp. Marseille-P3661]
MLRTKRLTVGSLKKLNAQLINETKKDERSIVKVSETETALRKDEKKICFIHKEQNHCFDLTIINKRLSLLDNALKLGLNIDYKCKQGRCGKCKINISQGLSEVSNPTEAETRKLGHELIQHFRLACQTYPIE